MKFKNLFPVWDKKKTIITSLFLAAAVLIAVLIGALNITVTANVSGREYSVDNIVSHVYAISKEEHSVFSAEENQAAVRNYITSTLDGYGIESEVIKHREVSIYDEKNETFPKYSPVNIYAEISGTSGTDVLLICHYDSCPYKEKYGEASEGSHGAIDDGYGVSVVLELARIYSQAEGLKNGIKLAFVDAEEVGCYGSEALVNERTGWLENVNLVLNVESRGETGPVYMFQTSPNNRKLIEFYNHAGFPYTFSLAAQIYDMMPNDTDLSPFIEHGYHGLNIATLDSLKTYHNEKDVFDSIDESTFSKYCDTLLPLLDEYALNEKYSDINWFDCQSDALFFTLFPNAMVLYDKVVGWVFFGITLAAVIALIVVLVLKKKINFVKAAISLAIDIGLLAVICGLGFIVALLSCACCGVNYHLIFVIGVPGDAAVLIAFGILAIAAVVASTLLKRKLNITYTEMTAGALVLYSLLCIVCAAALFGGSFAFVIPALLIVICAWFTFIKNDKLRASLMGATAGVAALFTLSFSVALIYSVYVSLTFGALGFMLVLFALPFTLILPPEFGFYGEEKSAVKAEKGVESV